MKHEIFEKEINYIKNERYKKNAEVLIDMLPDYFFKVPASSTGKYHPSFALNEKGLVRHTKVAVKIAHELLENNCIGYNFKDEEKDLILIALMMHDGLKHGLTEERYTRFDHPVLMASFIKENKDKTTLTEEEVNLISSVIASHMGQFNTNSYSTVVLPVPNNKNQRFVHMCDYLASRKFLDVKFDENNNIID